ncbi:unnamed protein product [Triticum turgidum subsp. durum]|uniref:Uncharacterized protein n=1 Tax=Triticum turgidum subsp. durum TaxID=4567 RepID=A0A9R1R4L6_TRITD|nr:unnamed protein product [Triticum turgidum subsp. durum]
MAREDRPEFVRWSEEFLSQERGSRVVHYYLEDVEGVSHLAVVGTERSLRHMLYVVSEDFHGPQGSGGADGGQGMFARKWRSRREVVDWLESFLPAKTLTSRSDHFGSIVRTLSLHFCKRLFPGLEPVTSLVTRQQLYRCARAPLRDVSIYNGVRLSRRLNRKRQIAEFLKNPSVIWANARR